MEGRKHGKKKDGKKRAKQNQQTSDLVGRVKESFLPDTHTGRS